MPVLRNVYQGRQPGRLGKKKQIIYDDDIDDSWLASAPSPRESHGRRREPGHIPRPRNAFIIFRSSYISGRASAGEGQQNELSKQAGKVWNKMTDEEKRPFVDDAIAEKKWHQAMYPNYTYCPGRGAARRKGKTVTKNTKNTSGPTRMSDTSSSSSPFSQLSPLPANPPANSPANPPAVHMTDSDSTVISPAVHMTDDNPLIFFPDGNFTQDWPQFTNDYSETPRMHVPDFAWSSYHENFPYVPVPSEEVWSEKDMTFMSSIINFEV